MLDNQLSNDVLLCARTCVDNQNKIDNNNQRQRESIFFIVIEYNKLNITYYKNKCKILQIIDRQITQKLDKNRK
jgi:hypothetical protein